MKYLGKYGESGSVYGKELFDSIRRDRVNINQPPQEKGIWNGSNRESCSERLNINGFGAGLNTKLVERERGYYGNW